MKNLHLVEILGGNIIDTDRPNVRITPAKADIVFVFQTKEGDNTIRSDSNNKEV